MSYGSFSPEWLEGHRVALTPAKAQEVVGIGHVQREVASLVGRLRNPEVVRAAGADLPRGILFHGAPGTGKTLTARTLATQLGDGVPFYELSSPTNDKPSYLPLRGRSPDRRVDPAGGPMKYSGPSLASPARRPTASPRPSGGENAELVIAQLTDSPDWRL